MPRSGIFRPFANISRPRAISASLRELFPVLDAIVDAHVRGTRYNIHVDAADGLLYAGETGVQLTWMDAKVGDRVVTPRIGKPVEINALWFNAAMSMAQFARALGRSLGPLRKSGAARANRLRSLLESRQTQFCFDVIDGPRGHRNKATQHCAPIRFLRFRCRSLP